MLLTVLVPTHRRAADLARCLEALRAQRRPPDQIVVVRREDDAETGLLLASYPGDLPIDVVESREPGQVAALNAGMARARGDVVAVTDDDTAPWPDWLERIERHFADAPELGGLGGRDVIRGAGESEPETREVCRLSWYGRWVGQAHRGTGPAREVELLKGCNMSYRRTAIAAVRFDSRLRGGGAQWFNDSAFSLAVRRRGWRVMYDPAIRVDHFLAPRAEGEDRRTGTAAEAYDVAYNETLILLEHLSPIGQIAFLGFGLAVGTQRAPGLLQSLRARAAGRRYPRRLPAAAWRGRLDAWREHRRTRPSRENGVGEMDEQLQAR